MKHIAVILLMAVSGFGQGAVAVSDKSTQPLATNAARRGNRVFQFKAESGNATGTAVVMAFHFEPSEPGGSHRLVYLKDASGNVTGEAVMPFQTKPRELSRTGSAVLMPFQWKPYEPRRGYRVFHFQNN